MRDMQPFPLELLKKTLDALDDLARSGRIVYQDYEGVVQIWRTRYQGQSNRFGIENFSSYPLIIKRLEIFCWNFRPTSSPEERRMPGMRPPL
jgi:hypothetical protein